MLHGSAIFAGQSESRLRDLARRLRIREAEKGKLVLAQGEVSDHIFFIESGRCEVRAQWAPGHSVTVALLTPGDFFGIGAIAPEHVQMASVIAVEDCDLLVLDRHDIDSVFAEGSSERAEFERLVEQRRHTIARMVDRAQAVSPHEHGMVIAVYAVKGGAGRTSIAVNVAAALGKSLPGECVLLDLGLPYNHAALAANLVPTGCLALIDHQDPEQFQAAVLSAALRHHSGMTVLPSALKVEQSELVTPQLVQRALGVLEQTFKYVVVDLGVSMSEVTLGVLERAARILVIVTPELPTLKDTGELLHIFETVLHIPAGHVSLVLNRPRPSTLVTREDAERVVERGMQLEIPFDGDRFDTAAVTGELLVTAAPSSPAAKAIAKLGKSITDEYRAHAGSEANP